ncbi:MAG: hypothetical protein O9302_12405 [Cyclobacteriaceae bacterium]|jgi:hypothetical protein|nr:hypothetical protein [Cyclobacteriaceae bacterium]
MKVFLYLLISSCSVGLWLGCQPKNTPIVVTVFSRQDSVMQQYLDLQDSLVIAWNNMVHDDNMKIKNLRYILHELTTGKQVNTMVEQSFTARLNQLLNIRFTEKTFSNADIVFEYDKQEEKLIEEITSMAYSSRFYNQNRMLQNLCNTVLGAEKNKNELRSQYNTIAKQFNQFVEIQKDLILHADPSASIKPKSLFTLAKE